MKTGWATFPGQADPNRAVAEACASAVLRPLLLNRPDRERPGLPQPSGFVSCYRRRKPPEYFGQQQSSAIHGESLARQSVDKPGSGLGRHEHSDLLAPVHFAEW